MFVGWLSMPALAADAEAWMSRFAAAEDSQSYVGTFIYERNGSFSSHAVWQAIEDGHTKQRLLQLDGPPVEVLLVDGEVQCASAQFLAQVPAGRAWSDKSFDVSTLSKWYDFRLIGDSRVADRPAMAVAVRPKDQHRYGFELHLDRESALALKSLMLGENGQLLERLQYTSLSVGSVDARDLQVGASCEAVKPGVGGSSQEAAWRSDWLPPGFQLLDSNVGPSPILGESVSWLSYGDGLARITVFLEPLHGAVVSDARSQLGPTVAVSKRLTKDNGDDVMVTVVGEVPLGTAERIALSMRPGDDQEGK